MTEHDRRKEDDSSTWRVDIERELGSVKIDIAEIRRDGVAVMHELRAISGNVAKLGDKQNVQPNLVALLLAGLTLLGGVGAFVLMQVSPLEKKQVIQDERQYQHQFELGRLYKRVE